ncbi:MAG: pyrroline-5-carboxylate reductase [Rhizobiales bacterium]|nr:pyrroline-5-carboxylate reductase [Hyphomicrobiales bacterium]
MTNGFPRSLALIGCGKMGGALLSGWLGAGLAPQHVAAVDPAPPADVAAVLEGAGIVASDRYGGGPAEVVVLAVKPQIMDAVLPSTVPAVGAGSLVISVAAGRTLASLAAGLPAGTAIVRVMPNTPSSVGRGMSVLAANAHVTPAQREQASRLLAAVGAVAWVEDEGLMDAVTGVSGSGPAYVFYMVECLERAGIAAGLPAELAGVLARQTVAGAGELLYQSPEPAAVLRQNVTSPNGTTAAGLAVLMADDGLDGLVERTVAAATRRSRELAG